MIIRAAMPVTYPVLGVHSAMARQTCTAAIRPKSKPVTIRNAFIGLRPWSRLIAGRSTFNNLGRPALRGAFAFVFVEFFFAEAQIFWRGFHVLVGADVFQRAFEGHLERRRERNAFAIAL
jgi:hypothetical protein